MPSGGQIVDGVAVTLAMTGAVVGEFIAANAGLGYLLTAGRANFDTTLVFAALAVLVMVAICGYTLITWWTHGS